MFATARTIDAGEQILDRILAPVLPTSEIDMLLSANAYQNRSANSCPPHATSLASEARATAPVITVVPSGQEARAEFLSADISTAQVRFPQTEILSMVAHEMRNALLPIRLAAAQLGGPFKDDAQLPRLRFVIERQLAHMSRLVGDLLDNSRAVNGKLRLEMVRVDLADVIAEAMDASKGCVASREQRLRTDLPAQALTVHGDPVRLVQIIGNLLTNASKYTPRGGVIEVSVALSGSTLQMTVADNGIGIAADVLPHVFEPFVQDAHAVAFDRAGLGIGLSVVRELVLAHGGSVVAYSAGHGLGSQFVVTLPLAERAGTANEGATTAPPACAPAVVLDRRLARRRCAVTVTRAAGPNASTAVRAQLGLQRAERIAVERVLAVKTRRALTLIPLARASRSRQEACSQKSPDFGRLKNSSRN